MAVLTFSREIAALGDEVAAAASEKLGYRFIGRKDIEERLVKLGFPKEKLHKYDERKPGFFASLAKDRDEYLDYLEMVVLEAASENNCILIGRGSFVILQQVPNRLSVRLVADDNVRVQRIMKEFGVSEKQAKQKIIQSDENRKGFHKSFFNVDNEESGHYHIVLNSGLMDIDTIANVICEATKKIITPEREAAGEKKIRELLVCQKVVNTLIFDYKININFLTATMNGNDIILHGVADSSSIIEKAVNIASREYNDYNILSAVSVVQDYRR